MREFKKPDLNAPRFRPKSLKLLNKIFYNHVKQLHPNLNNYSDEQIKLIVNTFNENIWKSVIEHRDGVELPEQLGYLCIASCPRKKFDNPDVIKSYHYGVKIQHQNWESDQYTAKIFYTNFETKYKFKFHEMWGFTGVRNFKRTVAKTYPLEWKKYVVVDNMTKVSRLFRKQIATTYKIKQSNIALETYDEFDMT
jgi:hypothetical protein